METGWNFVNTWSCATQRRAFDLRFFDAVEVGIQSERKLAGGQEAREQREARIKSHFLSSQLFKIGDPLFLSHSLHDPKERLRLCMIRRDLSFPLWIQELFVGPWHFRPF